MNAGAVWVGPVAEPTPVSMVDDLQTGDGTRT